MQQRGWHGWQRVGDHEHGNSCRRLTGTSRARMEGEGDSLRGCRRERERERSDLGGGDGAELAAWVTLSLSVCVCVVRGGEREREKQCYWFLSRMPIAGANLANY